MTARELAKYMQPIQVEQLRIAVKRFLDEGAKANISVLDARGGDHHGLSRGARRERRHGHRQEDPASEPQLPGDLAPAEKVKELLLFPASRGHDFAVLEEQVKNTIPDSSSVVAEPKLAHLCPARLRTPRNSAAQAADVVMEMDANTPIALDETQDLTGERSRGPWFLEIGSPEGTVRARIDLVRPLVLGASAGADIRVLDPTVSGRHCRVTGTPGGLVVDDLGFEERKCLLARRG